MKYIDEFRDGALAQALVQAIKRAVQTDRTYRLMEFCGGHTHAISRYGLEDILPPQVRMIHGPGCPVCVLPIGRIDSMVKTASAHKITLCTYGDTMRVPGSKGQSLLKARSRGADIRMVYSSLDALEYAIDHPGKEVVFFAIGFETTAPTTAVAIQKAAAMGVRNFSVYCCHVLTPAAMMHLMSMPVGGGKGTLQVDGVIGPSHVSTIIGTAAYNRFVEKFKVPVVIAGFEPLDVLQSIFMLVRQINHGHAEVENQFSRVVTGPGNLKARRLMEEIFELRGTFEWRGLGEVPHSALKIRDNYEWFDAEKRFSIEYHRVLEPKACECAAILCGVKQPADCRLFGHACIPEHPVGACMVSSEGACAAYYSYGRFRKADS